MKLIRKVSACLLLLCSLTSLTSSAQTGVWQDRSKTFLIPMMDGNELIGHAEIDVLDKVSKDSTSYAVKLYDEYLHDVGEKKLMLGSRFEFNKAAFNGKEIIAKFTASSSKKARYVVLNQKADVVFDTTLDIDHNIFTPENHEHFISTSMHYIPNAGVLDYYQGHNKSNPQGKITWIGNDRKVWQYSTEQEGITNYLFADSKSIINSVYEFKKSKLGNDVNTYIQGISTLGGTRTFELQLNTNPEDCIYPIAADIKQNTIEVVSEFTKRESRYGRIKWGIAIHRLDMNGKLIDAVFNDLTLTMRDDSVFKKNKLLIYSYLFMHKAIRLQNGKWLVAAEHIRRNFNAAVVKGKRKDVYNKKSICLMEVNEKAQIDFIFIEPNKEESVLIDYKYLHHPHNGSLSLLSKDRLDISYFMQDQSRKDECISFIFTDINGRAKKISLGQMKYINGEVKVDKFNIPLLTQSTRVNILPSRFGHVLLFKYDPYYGIIDFDNIKFNN